MWSSSRCIFNAVYAVSGRYNVSLLFLCILRVLVLTIDVIFCADETSSSFFSWHVCPLWDERLYALALFILSSGPFVWVLHSSILRMVPKSQIPSIYSLNEILVAELRMNYPRYYHFTLFGVFHTSISWWSFTGFWVTASLHKSPGLFLVFSLILIMVFTYALISSSSSPCTNPLVTVPSTPIAIGITVTFMFHCFFQFPKFR